MSLEARHQYRFGYLKSEAWKTVRAEALGLARGHCAICGSVSASNDAHHVWYPANFYQTESKHLVCLCRGCHEFVHSVLPECKTRDEQWGREQWSRFQQAVSRWRKSHDGIFIPDYGDRKASKLKRRNELAGKSKRYAARIQKADSTASILISSSRATDKNEHYNCHTRLLFEASFGLLDSVSEDQLKLPDRPISALWSGKLKTRGLDDLQSGSGVYMLHAGVLVGALTPRKNSETEKAGVKYLAELPADWPCFLCATLSAYIPSL